MRRRLSDDFAVIDLKNLRGMMKIVGQYKYASDT